MYSSIADAKEDFYNKKDFKTFFGQLKKLASSNEEKACEISESVLSDATLTELTDIDYSLKLQSFLVEIQNIYLRDRDSARSSQFADHFSCLVFRLSDVVADHLRKKANKTQADQEVFFNTIKLMKVIVTDLTPGTQISLWEAYRANAWLAFTHFMNPSIDQSKLAEYYFNQCILIYDKNKREVAENMEQQEAYNKKRAIFEKKLNDDQYQYVNFLYDYSLCRQLDATKNMYPKTGFNYLKLLSHSEKTLTKYAEPEQLINDFMKNAISNCILSKSDGSKSQLVNMIYSDVRAKRCQNYEIIEKLYKMKYLNDTLKNDFYASEGAPKTESERTAELDKGIKRALGRIEMADKTGMTNLDRIFLEHNIQVSALYYRDCNLNSLAERLSTDASILEHFLQNMNARGDIKVSIDHRDKLVTFKKQIQRSEENRIAIQRFCQILQTINQKYVG